MKRNLVGQVIKGVAGCFTVRTEEGDIPCFARGKLRDKGGIYIGDYVEITADTEGVIERIQPRKSALARPYVSNMDVLVIVVAPLPKPDMLLVDKLLIGALEQDIETILCINKADMEQADAVIAEIGRDYASLAQIRVVSTRTGQGVDELLAQLQGKFVCLAGQSAVGKSSLINAIFGEERCRTGDLSAKGGRGKNTTRHVEILHLPDGTRIADTCGFNMLEMPLFDPTHLRGYYTDFDEYAEQCRFRGCCHDKEQDCGVKRAAQQGQISQERYGRYLRLYQDIQKRWNKRYE